MYDNVRVAPKTVVKAVLNVPSTDCYNERQSLAKLSYCATDNVLTNLLPAGLQDFFQVFNVSNATTAVNNLLECSHISTSPLDLSLGYSAANFLVLQIIAHEDAKTKLFVVNDELAHHRVEKWSYYQTTSECLVVNADSERRHSNKNYRLWLKAEQTPVTFFLSSKLRRTQWCSVKKIYTNFQKSCHMY